MILGPVAKRDVNLVVEPGAIGLVGQNGAGKSTLMQILLGMLRPKQGTAIVLGHEVRSAGLQLRGRIGYMPERAALIPGLNGIEYVALAGELASSYCRSDGNSTSITSGLGVEKSMCPRQIHFAVRVGNASIIAIGCGS